MNTDLFNNVGKYIKNFAKVLSYWILGINIILGAAFIICGCALGANGTDIGWIGVPIGIGTFVLGYLLSKLAVMFLYAYGEMTDRLISIDTKMGKTHAGNNNGSVPTPNKAPVNKVPVNKVPRRTTPWDCPFCGHQNPTDARYCQSCGLEDIGE